MNRLNVGNVVTNGVQIASVGAVTGAGVWRGHQEKTLNNISPEEKKLINQYHKDRTLKEAKEFYEKNPNQNSDNGNGNDGDLPSVSGDEPIQPKTPPDATPGLNSGQKEPLNQKINNDIDYFDKWNVKQLEIYRNPETQKFMNKIQANEYVEGKENENKKGGDE